MRIRRLQLKFSFSKDGGNPNKPLTGREVKIIAAFLAVLAIIVGIHTLHTGAAFGVDEICPDSANFYRSEAPVIFLLLAGMEIGAGTWTLPALATKKHIGLRHLAFFLGCYFLLIGLGELTAGHTFSCYWSPTAANYPRFSKAANSPSQHFVPYTRAVTAVAYWQRVAASVCGGALAIVYGLRGCLFRKTADTVGPTG